MAAASLRRFVATLPSSTSLTSKRGGQRRGSLEFSPNRRQDDGGEEVRGGQSLETWSDSKWRILHPQPNSNLLCRVVCLASATFRGWLVGWLVSQSGVSGCRWTDSREGLAWKDVSDDYFFFFFLETRFRESIPWRVIPRVEQTCSKVIVLRLFLSSPLVWIPWYFSVERLVSRLTREQFKHLSTSAGAARSGRAPVCLDPIWVEP